MSLDVCTRRAGLALVTLMAVTEIVRADDFFETSVLPVLAENCIRCHGPDKQRGELRLDSREAALTGGSSGAAIVPGKPDESRLIKAVRHQDLKMPPRGKLSDEQIAALTRWIKDGAAWGTEKAGRASGLVARKPGQITDKDRAWWAFQPPARSPVPRAGAGWARTAIDHFIASRLEAERLAHAPEANRKTLIRRVTFDLTGLPPTPGEVAAFEADSSPDAYEKLVDRLLSSPRYGERQARAWLDLVRYAESDGYRADAPRPFAWKYRDYVIRSFNADKGYDRFVREQLAGDELYPHDPEARVATGYLRMWPYEYNQLNVRSQWSAILNDITDVTADTFLGLGMACARCHDHKFDPILQKDYFSLQAFFAGVRFIDEPMFPSAAAQEAYQRQRTDWEAKTADLRTRIDALVTPNRAHVENLFPPDIQVIIRKPTSDRTPGEQQLYELALRQVQYRSQAVLKGKQKTEYERLKKELDSTHEPLLPLAMITCDLGSRAAETVIPGRRKGSLTVEPVFPTVLGGLAPEINPTTTSTGRRAALAEWLTRKDNPLTARVLVNRVWQGHFGSGLVATPSDFGTLGDRPSHPELFDWLTVEFVDSGWSLKHLHRQIVTSAVYRQASIKGDLPLGAAPKGSPDRNPRMMDIENRLLWRMPIRRLDAEQVRDAMLAVSGELELAAGGPGVPADRPRRSVYTQIHRNTPDALLASFDTADGLTSCARRNVTVTPTQSLLLLNGRGTLARAEAFAARVMPVDGKDAPAGVAAAYRLAFGRSPTTAEAAEALDFLRQQVSSGKTVTPEARKAAWTDFCHTLLNTNEFLYVD
jgi:mono/diheme cytochrome c family protein